MKSEIILVTGTSGTGKTTILRALQKLGIEVIGIDEEVDLTGWVNKKTRKVFIGDTSFDEEFLASHEWICDLNLLETLLQKRDRPVVVCGSCDNIIEVMKLCDQTLILTCQPATFIQRINDRVDNDYGKSEAAKAALLGYYQQYYDECIAAGAIAIDAELAAAEVVDKVLQHIKINLNYQYITFQ